MENEEEEYEWSPEEGYDEDKTYTKSQLGLLADEFLKQDSRREFCRGCDQEGIATGVIDFVLRVDKNGEPRRDEEGEKIYKEIPQFICKSDHRWFKGKGRKRGIDGKDPILFEEHLIKRKKREIYCAAGTPDPSIESGIYNKCVDIDTKALTLTGWKSYKQLNIGDLIWVYDPVTDTCFWDSLLDIYTTEYKGKMISLESRNISALVTPGHRWYVSHERDKSLRYEVETSLQPEASRSLVDSKSGRFLKATKDFKLLNKRHYIPLARMPTTRDHNGELDKWELLGWVISDGHYKADVITRKGMWVSQALHNPKVTRLQDCLRRNNLSDQPTHVDKNNVGQWTVPAKIGGILRGWLPKKRVAELDLSLPTFGEAKALITGLVGGDGSYFPLDNGEFARAIYTTKRSEADAIQALCTTVGITTAVYERFEPKAFCPIEYFIFFKEQKGTWAYVRTALQEPVEYDNVVWCPTVASGFWMAGRNGKVYTTGNSHPQGRKVNTKEDRQKHGASYYK